MMRFFLSFLVFAASIPALAGSKRYDSNHILYWDDTSHLRYMLNTDTKEAVLGDGIDEEKNAMQYPPMDDDWWTNQPNLWEHVVVAESIEFQEEVYTVTGVSSNAFYKSTEVKTVKLPNTIKEIGSYAFGYCVNLVEVNIPEGVIGINAGTFYCCI